jgi:hypothetical protein
MEIKGLNIKLDQYHFMVWHDNKLMFKETVGYEKEHCLAQKMEMLLKEVYKLGFDDGYSEGSSDTASAIQSDISYRNGYLG